MTWLTLALTTLAVARGTRAVTTDLIAHGLRSAVVRRWPRGHLAGDASWPATLVHCDYCVSFWLAGLATLGLCAAGAVPWPWGALWWPAVAMAAGFVTSWR